MLVLGVQAEMQRIQRVFIAPVSESLFGVEEIEQQYVNHGWKGLTTELWLTHPQHSAVVTNGHDVAWYML